MTAFTVADCLVPDLLHVQLEQRYRDTIQKEESARVFAVFDSDRYKGLVTEKQAALFPSRIFADLLVLREPEALLPQATLDVALEQIQRAKADYLPVIDEVGTFLGAVSHASLFAGLSAVECNLRMERETLIERIEAELRNHRIAATVFDNTSEGILVTDSEASIILVNSAFTKSTGYALDELRGRHPNLLDSGRHNRRFYLNILKSLRDNGEWRGEIWSRHRDGEIYPEWLHINAIIDNGSRISHYVAIFSDIFHQKHIQRHLQQLAYYDTLTDLPNRQLFYDRIGLAITDAFRRGTGFSLLFLDFDGFKDVNDSLGHGFGDKLLKAAAERLRTLVRDSDTVARLGGDEFTVLVRDTRNEQDAATVAAKIVESFAHPFDVENHKIFLTASVGIARYPEDGEDVDTLVKNADAAMYLAKEDGRNRYRFFTTQLNVDISERLYMENALRSSLQEGGLYLMWQPQVRLSDGCVVGLEALARWHHPKLGNVPPSRFIPVAEKAGLMQSFGSWILHAVSLDIARLSELRQTPPLRFAVNFSSVQIYDGDALKQDILHTLDSSRIEPENFVLEVTESIFMSRGHSADTVLAELGGWGLQIAIDDFGTGYSNLAYLKRFAVHHLKIDKSFIRDLVEDATSRQLVTAIIQMAHSLKIRVIAEGVETQQQREILVELGCDEGQGYLFGRPMKLEQLANEDRLDTTAIPDFC